VEIPVVDFANWKPESTSAERKKVAEEIVDACKSVGFLCIVNHGISSERLAEAFSWSKKFFDLSPEQKRQAPHPDGSAVHRGYSWPGLEKVSDVQSAKDDPELAKKLREITDYKVNHASFSLKSSIFNHRIVTCSLINIFLAMQESYDMGSDRDSEQPNVWIPDATLPGFREFMRQFYWDCFGVGGNILKAIALGLGLEEDHLLKIHSGHNNQLRLLHYPSILAEAVESQKMARMPPHTDWSSITMLFQDDCGGLEVEDIDHPLRFIPATPIKDAIVMNVGDLLQRWSNGMLCPIIFVPFSCVFMRGSLMLCADILRSTKHRVTLPPLSDRYNGPNRMVRERYSIPYFLAPDPDSVVECLPTCATDERSARYFPISQREYNQLRATMHYQTQAELPGTGVAY
jgi:isopenicillin N synthase-like dioxygenase